MSDTTLLMGVPSRRVPNEGSLVAGYLLGSVLGRGAQGVVYRATKPGDEQPYAVKIVELGGLTEAELARLRRETTLTSRMGHPGIITVHQVVEANDWMAIVMDQALGRPADSMCDGSLGWELSLRIVIAAARALDYAHRRNGLIHRDIKPANLIVDVQGGVLRGVKVVDFGLGRDHSASEDQLTMTGQIMGTPLYMSPEQGQGERHLTFATDIYSLGATLFHLVSGRPVFNAGSPVQTIIEHCKSTPPTLSSCAKGCPIALSELVGYCLAKSPTERFRSYRTFLAMAEPILGGNPFDLADATAAQTQQSDGPSTRSAWRRPEHTQTASTARVGWRPRETPAQQQPAEGSSPQQSTRWLFPTLKPPVPVPKPAEEQKPTTTERIRNKDPTTETTDRLPQEVEMTVGPAPDTRPPEPSLPAGTAIDEHFVVVRALGAGAMGEVFEVEDRFIGRRLAMKIMSEPDMRKPAAVARFKCEATALASVGHVAFPYLAGGGTYKGRDYLYMELVRGTDLRTWLHRQGGSLPERQALAITLQLVQAMEAAYRVSGMVHRDLKPANIMVAENHDGTPQVRIIDFGVSVYIDFGDWDDYSSRAYTYVDDGNEGRVVGTPAYMSPEQVQAEPPSPTMDMYAIGAILHQLLTGRTPFTAPGVPAMMMKILHENPPTLDDVPSLAEATRQLVRRMLAKKAEARYKNYKQLAAAVGAALHGRSAG